MMLLLLPLNPSLKALLIMLSLLFRPQ